MSVAKGPSGKNDFYLNSLDQFLTDTHTIAAENDDTQELARLAKQYQENNHLYFLFGSGSNQHNQLLLNSANNAARLVEGEDAHKITEIALAVPKEDDHLPTVKNLFVGGGHSGLLSSDGKLYLWGWNESGQLGRENETSESNKIFPIPPLQGYQIETAALGFSHSLVLERETQRILAFGSNDRGQVTGTLSETKVPTPYTPEILQKEKIIALAAGLFHSAVITEDGELITFGCGRFGQSLPAENKESLVGRWKPDNGVQLVNVSCGRRHTIAIDENNCIYSFGENKYGQLGRTIDGTKDSVPQLITGFEPPIPKEARLEIVGGWSHTVLIAKDLSGSTTVYGWGRNDKGQLGTGTTENISTPIQLFKEMNVQSMACGSESTMLLDTNDGIWACGWNEHGNLALGDSSDVSSLSKTVGARIVGPNGSGTRTILAAGGAHVLACKGEI